jgi:hypothetical protein
MDLQNDFLIQGFGTKVIHDRLRQPLLGLRFFFFSFWMGMGIPAADEDDFGPAHARAINKRINLASGSQPRSELPRKCLFRDRRPSSRCAL